MADSGLLDLHQRWFQWHNKPRLFRHLAGELFCVAGCSKVIKTSKAAGFNNPAGRAQTSAVDLLEPADAFNISVPGR
jgi:hypothetical protein